MRSAATRALRSFRVSTAMRTSPHFPLAKPLALQVMLACALLGGCEQFANVGSLPEESGAPTDASFDAPARDAARDADMDAAASLDSGTGKSCPREVAVCNPVDNTGCLAELETQCAPDLTSDSLAGYCTFVGPIQDAGLECFNSVATESCPPTMTCFSGRCRSLCFCDADCGEGLCCTEPLGDQGFFLCAPCGE